MSGGIPFLEPDTTLTLPSLTVLKASAGSGKTYALTERYVQFLLSPLIPRNLLPNLLAITFSNNAAREMRESVMGWLKRLYFRDAARCADIGAVTAGGEERTVRRAGELVDEILSRYSDFQVRTIDSFMSTIFRASAIDFGFSPEFEIVMDPDPLIDYAFTLCLRETREGTERAALLDETIRTVLDFKGSDDSFPWDPTPLLLAEVKKIEPRLAQLDERPAGGGGLQRRLGVLGEQLRASLERVAALVVGAGLQESTRSAFKDALSSARAGRFTDLISRGMKSMPVKKPPAKNAPAMERWESIQAAWEDVERQLGDYTGCWARAYYQPYIRLHEELASTVEKVKRGQGKVFIGDINRTLGEYLSQDIVPDIYFRIGERVWHFLVDEFQDTSPIQWRNLHPLVENSLAAGGSLFVVGDTKQAIYGFRQADYTIMRSLEAENPFPSAGHAVRELERNWRSRPRVLAAAAETFRVNAAGSADYREAARRSGLDAWTQEALEGDDPGYAEVEILARADEDPPERRKLLEVAGDLRRRGYRWGDIAVLAAKNEHIIRATSWLNEAGIPFISFSSLDVRTRGIAGEILGLLGFLDSPPDDLSFSTFLLGDIFGRTLMGRYGWASTAPLHEFLFKSRADKPLYKAFQRDFPTLWKELFAALFRSAGYLPLYDLVSEAYAAFDAFTLAGEEQATLAKLLEAVSAFEGSGTNSLREFLGQAAGDGGEWAIAVPRSADSVRAMTIHKAKGLGFPVTIVLLYGDAPRGRPYTLLRENGSVGLVKITRPIAARDPLLQALYDEEAVKEKVERLNGLYVALTRAKRELYVIGVKRDKDGFPFDILPADLFPPREEKGPAVGEEAPAESGVPLSHEARTVPVSFGSGRLGREERRRGELVHRMLELIEYAGDGLEADLLRAGERAAAEAREDPAQCAAAAGTLARMIRSPGLAGLFARAGGRTVLREQEVCDARGRLSRMDRIVVDPDRVTVIDFKTGEEEPGEHERQLRGYMEILSPLYPGRAVAGVAAYVDRGLTRRWE
jgi:ATP-dependent helicase/nuclease subunit A